MTQQLAERGYEVFLPTYRVRRRWSDRIREIEQPLFESYTFCRLDRSIPARVVTTPGVIQIVGVAGQPVAIEEHEMAALRRLAESCRSMMPWPFLSIGQRVRIESGSLAGLEGLLESVRSTRRIVVSVSLLQRSVAVELDREVVVPIESRRLVTRSTGGECHG